MKQTKICKDCEVELPKSTDYFYSNGYTPNGTQKFKARCKSCESSSTKTTRLSKIKSIVGDSPSCRLCGYDRCFTALEFHHLVSDTKVGKVSALYTSNIETLKAEVSKCVLIAIERFMRGLVQVTEADLQSVE